MTDGLPLPRRYPAIAALSFGTALIIIDGGVANVALPTIARDLGVDIRARWCSVVTVYQLMLVMILLPFAGLGERIGLEADLPDRPDRLHRRDLPCASSRESLPFLLIVRAAQALGAAAALSVSSALIRATYPAKSLGSGLGINSRRSSPLRRPLAPTLGGLILAVASWPWVFAAPSRSRSSRSCSAGRLPDPKPHDDEFRPARRSAVRGDLRADRSAGWKAASTAIRPVVSAAIVAGRR